MSSALAAAFFSCATTFSLPGDTINVGSNVRFFSSTPISFLGRSMMCPTDARTSKPAPRYFSIVFALAGDSTITSDLLIALLDYNYTLPCPACSVCWTLPGPVPLPSQTVQIRPLPPAAFPLREKLTAKIGNYHETPPYCQSQPVILRFSSHFSPPPVFPTRCA